MRSWTILQILVLAVVAIGTTVDVDARPPRTRNNIKEQLDNNRAKRKWVTKVVTQQDIRGRGMKKIGESEFDSKGNTNANRVYEAKMDGAESELISEATYEFTGKGRVKKAKNRKPRGEGNNRWAGPGPNPHRGSQTKYVYPSGNDSTESFSEFVTFAATEDSTEVQSRVAYQYDGDDDVTGMTILVPDSTGVEVVQSQLAYTYEGTGDEKRILRIEESAPGREKTVSYVYTDSSVTETTTKPDGTVLAEVETLYDDDGNPVEMKQKGAVRGQGGAAALETLAIERLSYEYDEDGKLLKKKMVRLGRNGQPESELITSFDGYGNECDQSKKNLKNGEMISSTHREYTYRPNASERHCACEGHGPAGRSTKPERQVQEGG